MSNVTPQDEVSSRAQARVNANVEPFPLSPSVEELSSRDIFDVLESKEAPLYPSLPMYRQGTLSPYDIDSFSDQDITRVDPVEEKRPPLSDVTRHSDELAPRLQVISGKDLGQVFLLSTLDTSVGRSVDNDIILNDLAASRHHIKLIRDQELIRLRDVGSGNGTFVNGTRILETTLKEGDRIEIGSTVLRFHLPRAVGRPLDEVLPRGEQQKTPRKSFKKRFFNLLNATPVLEDRAPQRTTLETQQLPAIAVSAPGTWVPPVSSSKRRLIGRHVQRFSLTRPWILLLMIVTACLVVMLGAVAAAMLEQRNVLKNYQNILDRGVFERGTIAFGAKHWDEAEAAFKEVLLLQPEHARSFWYLAMIQKARRHQTFINNARQLLGEGKSQEALDQLNSVTSDSPLISEAEAVRLAAKTQLSASLAIAAKQEEVKGHMELAREKMREARVFDPGHRAIESTPKITGRVRDKSDVSLAPRGTNSQAEPSSLHRTTDDSVLSLYRRGEFSEAANLARELAQSVRSDEAKRLKILALDIDRFGSAYKRLTQVQPGQYPPELSDVRNIVQLDEELSGGHYGPQLLPRLAQAYVAHAQTLAQDGKLLAGCSAVRQALGISPDDLTARALSEKCVDEARLLMERAQSLESDNINEARLAYRRVLSIAPVTHPIHREAAESISRLASSRGI